MGGSPSKPGDNNMANIRSVPPEVSFVNGSDHMDTLSTVNSTFYVEFIVTDPEGRYKLPVLAENINEAECIYIPSIVKEGSLDRLCIGPSTACRIFKGRNCPENPRRHTAWLIAGSDPEIIRFSAMTNEARASPKASEFDRLATSIRCVQYPR